VKQLLAVRYVVAFLFASVLISSSGVSADERSFSEMIVFSDSTSDTGNAFLLSGGDFIAPPYFEGRASNGPVAVEQAAKRLGLPSPMASLLGGTNYAVSGATTGGPSLVGAPDLGQQIGFFFAGGNTLDGDELIVVWAGANDALALFLGGDGDPIEYLPATAVENIVAHIETLAAAGGEIFIVPNAASLGVTPLIQNLGVDLPFLPMLFDDWAFEFNDLLAVELTELEDDLGLTILQWDWGGLYDEMLAMPKKFALKNITEPACPDCGFGFPLPGAEDSIVNQPNKYFFWDLVHSTEKVHKVWGKDLAKFVKEELGISE
jgi:phospholipase/lecithinase/hemolysin